MTLKGNFIHQSSWLFKYFQKICWKLISMPFICYTVAQYGGNSHRYHICIFMQTFTWINGVFCMSGFPFRHKSLFPRAHFQDHAENRALKQCLAAAAFPQCGSELAILNLFFLCISGAVQDPLSILNPYEHASLPMATLQLTANSFPCKRSSRCHILEFALSFPQKAQQDLQKHLGICILCLFSSLEIQTILKNGNGEGKMDHGKKKWLTKIFRLPSCRKALFSCSFSQIDGDEELPRTSCPNQSLGKPAPTATDVGSGPGSALNFLWDWASYLKLVVLQHFINSSEGQITV